jgi:hypothetical protein
LYIDIENEPKISDDKIEFGKEESKECTEESKESNETEENKPKLVILDS